MTTPLADPWQAAVSGAILAPPPMGVLSFTGPDAATFLQGQLSSDIKALAPGTGQRSTYNSPKGRMLATLFVGRPSDPAPDRYIALVAADLAAALARRLAMYVLRSKVAVANETPALSLLGVGGPLAAQAVANVLGAVTPPGSLAASGEATIVHLPEARLVILVPAAKAGALNGLLAAHATPAPVDVWTWLGIRAGVPSITTATQDLFVAQTANQDALGAIDFRKGCYTGQEIVARTHYLGRLKERLYLLAGAIPPPVPATRLYSPQFGEQACGTVVESAPQPGGGSVALAVLQTAAATGPVAIGAADGPAMTIEPLPYPLPEPTEPRGRVRL
jgi:folate-binding protein YgfZ